MVNKMKKIVLIVGASGVGKDTLLRSIKDKIKANFLKRYITRIPDNNESNYYIDEKAFLALKDKDYFISSWEAHGNYYGIAKEHIKDGINIISISRGAVEDFEKVYDEVLTINITLPKEIMIKRLHERGRESMEEIIKRVDRASKKVEAKCLIEFDNSQSLENSAKKFIKLIEDIDHEK